MRSCATSNSEIARDELRMSVYRVNTTGQKVVFVSGLAIYRRPTESSLH